MKSKMFKKLMAAVLATTMTVSLAACGGDDANAPVPSPTPGSEQGGEEVGPTNVLTDANGNVYDLGGMEIIIRDWWTNPDQELTTQYDEDTAAYREYIQKTYNFKIKQMAISDWGNAPQDFVNYVTDGGDENNYAFVLRADNAVTNAMKQGQCYDLSTLDCLDFSDEKFTKNLVNAQYSMNGKVYAMNSGASEPRTGVYFNRRLLEDAQIDPDSIYDMQANGTWTWDAFLDLCAKVQRDTNNDGEIDVWACNANNSNFTNAAVFSNGGEYVGLDANGKYVYRLEDDDTMEALQFAMQVFDNYWQVEPDGAEWNYYENAFLNGEFVFLFDDAYYGQKGATLGAKMEDEWGFVMFPKGPKMKDYTNCWSNNLVVIPGCYDADRAWKIAFAWNLYTNDTPGWEGQDEAWKAGYMETFEERALEETLAKMRVTGMVTYDGLISDMNRGPDLTWGIAPGAVVSEKVEATRDRWKALIDAENQ